jgi:ketosteroid isomerase-like protein
VATARNETDGILAANGRFYQAFEKLDMEAMISVWAKTDYVRCIHPGWRLLVGWDAVRASWEIIFRNTREIRFTLTDVQVQFRGNLAWVTLTENILSHAARQVRAASVLATNVFEKMGPAWLMIHHHASHIMTPPVGGDSMTLH